MTLSFSLYLADPWRIFGWIYCLMRWQFLQTYCEQNKVSLISVKFSSKSRNCHPWRGSGKCQHNWSLGTSFTGDFGGIPKLPLSWRRLNNFLNKQKLFLSPWDFFSYFINPTKSVCSRLSVFAIFCQWRIRTAWIVLYIPAPELLGGPILAFRHFNRQTLLKMSAILCDERSVLPTEFRPLGPIELRVSPVSAMWCQRWEVYKIL